MAEDYSRIKLLGEEGRDFVIGTWTRHLPNRRSPLEVGVVQCTRCSFNTTDPERWNGHHALAEHAALTFERDPNTGEEIKPFTDNGDGTFTADPDFEESGSPPPPPHLREMPPVHKLRELRAARLDAARRATSGAGDTVMSEVKR